MATQMVNKETLKSLSNEKLRQLLRTTGGRDLEKVQSVLRVRRVIKALAPEIAIANKIEKNVNTF